MRRIRGACPAAPARYCPLLPLLPRCENLLYGFKAAPHGAARVADSAARPTLPLTLPLRPGLTPVGWREGATELRAANPDSHQGRGGFDKGTLAAALIGLMRAGQKPARSPGQRTGVSDLIIWRCSGSAL